MNAKILKRIMKYQQSEILGAVLYERIAYRQKNEQNKKALLELSAVEQKHYITWKQITNKDLSPSKIKIQWYLFLNLLLGFTFTVKLLELMEGYSQKEIEWIAQELPEVRAIVIQDIADENPLLDLMDEERLQYVGAMVLGLNDALVELTGTIAGLTFALANTRLIALSGIITGISATFSMAASNYLAEKAEGNNKALKSSLYTGIAYLVTVILLVLPYLLFPSHLYAAALGVMIIVVIVIILVFNFYISVAQSTPFLRRFAEMALISLGVAVMSFAIGLAAKALLGIDI